MDVVKAATFEAVIQSSITTCDGQPLCLEEVNVDGEVFIGLGTGCEERLRWTNNKYVTLTDEEHYNTAQNGTVPAETQKWVITSKSGCLKQLNDFYPPIAQEYADGHRLAVDPACQTGFDSEFWAISSPFHVNDTVDAATGSPFTIVESHVNRTRRLAYYVNATKPYTTEAGKNCTCVDPLDDPLGTLMVTQAHVHETRPDKTESYWYGRDACDGHVLRVVIFPPCAKLRFKHSIPHTVAMPLTTLCVCLRCIQVATPAQPRRPGPPALPAVRAAREPGGWRRGPQHGRILLPLLRLLRRDGYDYCRARARLQQVVRADAAAAPCPCAPTPPRACTCADPRCARVGRAGGAHRKCSSTATRLSPSTGARSSRRRVLRLRVRVSSQACPWSSMRSAMTPLACLY